MAKIGWKSYVGYCEQTTLTTGIAPTGFVEYNSEGFKKNIEEKLIDAINGTLHYKKRVTLNQSVEGSISFPMVPGIALRLLKNGVGDTIVATSLAANVMKYVFAAGVSSVTGMSFEVCRDTGDTTAVARYTGCVLDGIKFSANVNDILMCETSLKGINEVLTASITTASYRTYTPYTYVQGSIKVGDTSPGSAPSVDSWSVNIANNFQEVRVIGTSTVAGWLPAMQDVTYEISAFFDDNNLYNRFLNGTASYIFAKFDTGVTIASTYTHSIQFESFKSYFNGSTPNIGGPSELIKASYPIRSIFNDASSTTLFVTVITDVMTLTTA